MTYSLAFNFVSDSHFARLAEAFSDCNHFFICAKSAALKHSKASITGGYGIEFRQTLEEILASCQDQWILLLLKPTHLVKAEGFDSWIKTLAADSDILSYSSHIICKESAEFEQPLIDYQAGSVKDDFDFGPLVFLNVKKATELLAQYPDLIVDDQTALYALRLAASLQKLPVRNQSFAYKAIELEKEDQHAQHFAYASAAGAAQQKAFEKTFVEFSKVAGFYSVQKPLSTSFENHNFGCEASVIIPVKNRKGKVEHAVVSALNQKTEFKFNVIVVDNHSDDGTTEVLKELGLKYPNLVHIIPERRDLGIGGCWQLAIEHALCGRFCAQLDSDDLYIDESVLAKIVSVFHVSNCAAVVGSYMLVDKDLNPIPPGAIEHREWNDHTGYINILRINGLGAPRAYYTPAIREVGFPNVSYGEDYSAMLGITRKYKIARIYEHLYLCRRWEGNSDAQPSIEKMNRFNFYKDSLRTAEIENRKIKNRD